MKKIALYSFFFALSFSCFSNADEYGFPDSYPEVYQQTEVLPFLCRGWEIYEHIFDPMFAKKEFHTVIEVGVYMGKLTLYLADKLPATGRYFAVDHWKGSQEHLVAGAEESPYIETLYQQFLSNVIHKGLVNKVIPVRMNSVDAAKKFKKLNIKGDLIYIDAGHDYISVLQDLNVWYPLLADDGVFCGDDWNYGGVRTAVQQFAVKKGLKIKVHGNFWLAEM